jgi:ABC-2 type transport system permease protein
MRNVLLIVKREYLVRVRTKAFVFFTLFLPLFLGGMMVLSARLAMKSTGVRRIVIVSPDAALANAVKDELVRPHPEDETESQRSGDRPSIAEFEVTVESSPTDALRQQLADRLRQGTLDAFAWLDVDTPATRKVSYYSRNGGDFVEGSIFRRSLRMALNQRELLARGLTGEQIEAMLGPVDVDMVHIDKDGAQKSNGFGAFLLPMFLMLAMYMTVLIYGITVMRSVIEEKSSRVVEVLLGSVTPMQLMAGKIIGVGAVGLTQLGIWLASGIILGGQGFAASGPVLGDTLQDAHVPTAAMVLLPVFFVLGYLTYSCLYAAIGAMCNSDDEAQQLQLPVTLPLLLCMTVATAIMRDPNTPLAFWLSIFPLTSPIIMFVRVCLGTPPAWQLALSIAVSIVSLYGLIWVSARIYRVGILMYGKRPTLPEILRWIRYA